MERFRRYEPKQRLFDKVLMGLGLLIIGSFALLVASTCIWAIVLMLGGSK